MENSKRVKGKDTGPYSKYQVLKDPKVEAALNEQSLIVEIVEKRARKDGLIGIPKYDQKTVAEAELQMKAASEKCGLEVGTILSPLFAKVCAQLESKSRLKLQFDENPYKAVTEISKQGGDQLGKTLKALDNEKNAQVELIDKEITYFRKEEEKDLTERNKTEDKLEKRPRKRSKSTSILYHAGVVVIILGDTFLIVRNLEEVAEMPFVFSCITALALGSGIAVSGHYFGSSLKGKHKIGMIGSLIGGLVILAFFYYLRTQSGGLGMMTLANLGLFIVFSIMAYFYEYDNPKLTKKYFADEKAARKNAEMVNQLKKKKIDTESKFDNQEVAILKKHHNDLDRKIKEYKLSVTREVEELMVQKQEVEQYYQSCMQQICALYEEQVRRYRNLNQDERKDKGIQLVEMWEESNYVEPLKLPGLNEFGVNGSNGHYSGDSNKAKDDE